MHIFASLNIGALLFVALGRVQELFLVLDPLRLGKLTVLMGLIAVFALNPTRITVLFKETPIGHCLVILMVLAFAGIPFSVLKSGALEAFLGYCRMLLIASIMTGLCIHGREQVFRMACVWVILLMSILMIMSKGTGRVHISSTYDPNDMAFLFVVYLPIIATEALVGSSWIKIAAAAASVCSLIAIPFTGSRGGILALTAIGLHSVFLIKKRRWLLIPALALGALIVGLTADETLWERFQTIQDNTDYNLDAQGGRLAIWKEGLRLMFRYPLLGVGIEQFPVALGMLGSGAWKAAHNSFIQIGTELGLIGLGTFCAIIIFIIRLTIQGVNAPFLAPMERHRFMALRISLTGYCVGGAFLSQAYGAVFYMLLVLSAAMYLQLKAAKREYAAAADKKQGDRPAPAGPAPASALLKSRPGRIALRAAAARQARQARLLKGDEKRKLSARMPGDNS